jgi:hypothetical protein
MLRIKGLVAGRRGEINCTLNRAGGCAAASGALPILPWQGLS